MRSGLLLLLMLAATPIFALAQSRSEDERAIGGLVEEINRAFVSREAEPFERIFADNYISVRSKPIYNGKEQLIAMVKADAAALKAGRPLEFETLKYESDIQNFRFYGQTAIVTLAKRNEWRYRASKCLTRYQATEVWTRTSGEWKLLASQMTTFQCSPMPWLPPHPAVSAVGTETRPPAPRDLASERSVRAAFSSPAQAAENLTADILYSDPEGSIHKGQAAVGPSTKILAAAGKDNEAMQFIGDAGIYTFRIRQGESARELLQCMAVLVRRGDRWLGAALHCGQLT